MTFAIRRPCNLLERALKDGKPPGESAFLTVWRATNPKPPETPDRIDENPMINIAPETPSSWWRPDVHADRRPFLMARNRIQAALRDYFLGGDFIEVDTAALQVSPGNETHLHAFRTE